MAHDESHEDSIAAAALDASLFEDASRLEPIVHQVAGCFECRDSIVDFMEELLVVGVRSHEPRLARMELLLEHAMLLVQDAGERSGQLHDEAEIELEEASERKGRNDDGG